MNVKQQLYWEDIAIGQELPALVKKPTTKTIVMWAGATDAYGEMHYDKDIALKNGFQGVILHGEMLGAYLMQLFAERIGARGYISSISYRHGKPAYPNQAFSCRAKATRKFEKDDKAFVVFDTWVEDEAGEKASAGSAAICLPKMSR